MDVTLPQTFREPFYKLPKCLVSQETYAATRVWSVTDNLGRPVLTGKETVPWGENEINGIHSYLHEGKNVQWDQAVSNVLSPIFIATGSGLYHGDVLHINLSGENCGEFSSFIK